VAATTAPMADTTLPPVASTPAVTQTVAATTAPASDPHVSSFQASMGAYPGCTAGCATGGVVDAKFTGGLNGVYEYTLKGISPSLKAATFERLATYQGMGYGTGSGSGSDAPPSQSMRSAIELDTDMGVVVEHRADGTILFTYGFTMNEKSATGGVHIHAGSSCVDPGPHYWNDADKTVPDPWGAATMWTSDAAGTAKGSFAVDSGRGYADNTGKVVVVHDSSGAKMACAVLEGASGGVHVHVGTTCAAHADVGGHYYTGATDNWNGVGYVADKTTVAGTFAVNDGHAGAAHEGHAVVVHSAAGARIGCGVLKAPTFSLVGTGGCRGKRGKTFASYKFATAGDLAGCLKLCAQDKRCTGVEHFPKKKRSNCQLQNKAIAASSMPKSKRQTAVCYKRD